MLYFLLQFYLITLDERSGVIELKDNQEISLSNFISKNKKGDISRDDVASMKNAMSFKLINSPSDREIYDLPVNDVRFDVVGYNTCISPLYSFFCNFFF